MVYFLKLINGMTRGFTEICLVNLHARKILYYVCAGQFYKAVFVI